MGNVGYVLKIGVVAGALVSIGLLLYVYAQPVWDLPLLNWLGLMMVVVAFFLGVGCYATVKGVRLGQLGNCRVRFVEPPK